VKNKNACRKRGGVIKQEAKTTTIIINIDLPQIKDAR